MTEDGRLAGGAAITRKKGVFVLNDLAVEKELRSSGIGMLGDFRDLHTKAHKAIYTEGPCFLNVLSPCPRGWQYDM